MTYWIFGLSSLLIVLGVYWGIPFFMKRGLLFSEAYLFCFHFSFILLFFGSFILYRREGNALNMKSFADRLRLKSFDRQTWKWLGIFLPLAFIGFALSFYSGDAIARLIPSLQPEFLPPELNFRKEFQFGYFFDMKLQGRWDFALLYTLGWLFNIFGEEFMFRGMLLPLHEKHLGKKAWIFHFIIWGLWHIYWMWAFVPITLFISIPLILSAYKSKNTWVPIIVHGALNFVQIIYIYSEVIK